MNDTLLTPTRRQALKALGISTTLRATGLVGSVSAQRGRNKRFVLRPDFEGLVGGAVGTREEAHTLAGAWRTAVDTDGDDADDKLQLYLTPDYLFQNAGAVTINDLTHVSYHTKKDQETSGSEPYNVYLQLYTEPDGTDDQASWYGYRITAEPYFSQDLDAPGSEWVEWSTEDGSNQLTFFDDAYVGFGFYGGQPTLEELQAGPIDWSERKPGAPETNIDYGQEVIKYITFQTGSGYPESFDAFLDTIEIGISTGAGRGNGGRGQVARVDLEA